MLSSDELLEKAAREGALDIAQWPRVLENMLKRLHDIVYNEFPVPPLPLPPPLPPPIDPEVVASTPPRISSSESEAQEHDMQDADHGLPPNSQSSTKENDAPTDIAAGRRRRRMLPGYEGYEISESQQTEEVEPPTMEGLEMQKGMLPPDLLSSFQMSLRALERNFTHGPPHTIQRLAELVLHPKKHYRFLPAYLRAIDRAVCVSSPLSDFPLPALQAPAASTFLTNGEPHMNGGLTERDRPGRDESLGGTLLTPIPWLRSQSNFLTVSTTAGHGGATLPNEPGATADAVNGVGGAGTTSPPDDEAAMGADEARLREQGGLTQGELLRREQEAGMVPTDQFGEPLMSPRVASGSGGLPVGRAPLAGAGSGGSSAPDHLVDEGAADDLPHARGPAVIGMEDLGPQPQGSVTEVMLQHDRDTGAAGDGARSRSPPPQPALETLGGGADGDENLVQVLGEPGHPGRDPQDVEKDVEKLRDAMDRDKVARTKDADGDVVVADADGTPVDGGDME